MGGSSSSNSTQIVNNKSVTTSQLNQLSETVNNTVSNTIMSTAQKCGQLVVNAQHQDLTLKDVSGGLHVKGGTQNMESAVAFNCSQMSTIKGLSTSAIVDTMASAIQNHMTTSAQAELAAEAESSASKGFGALPGGGNSDANTYQETNYNQETTIIQNIRSALTTNVETNNVMESVSACVSTANNIQTANIEADNVSGGVDIQYGNQVMMSSVIGTCIQEANIGSEITSSAAKMFGVTVENSSETSSSTKMKAEASSKATAAGIDSVISSVFDGISGVIGSVTGGILGAGALYFGTLLCSCCLIICCCIACMFFMTKSN